MNIKEYVIDGKVYDLSKVAESIDLGKIDDAKFTFELLTGKSGEEFELHLNNIKAISESAITDFRNCPIEGGFYNVEKVMELLLQGDAMGAYNTLQLFGLSDDVCKKTVQRLMKNLDGYKQSKGANESGFEKQLIRERSVDPDWFAPTNCPSCGSVSEWGPVGQTKGGFSGGKAVAGAILLGPLGLAAGALGKKQTVYQCSKCGHTEEYSKGSKLTANIMKKF